MPRLICSILLMLMMYSSGCAIQYRVCNGTSEPVEFRARDSRSRLDQSVLVEPCSCDIMRIGFETAFPSLEDPFQVVVAEPREFPDREGRAIEILEMEFEGGLNINFDGFELSQSPFSINLNRKNTVTLRNDSAVTVRMRSGLLPSRRLAPGESYEFITTRNEPGEFRVSASDGSRLAQCTPEILDGLQVVWDGTNLTCGFEPPSGDVDFELCNEDPQQFAPPVIFITDDEDPNTVLSTLSGVCRTITVSAGAPVTFEVWCQEAVIMEAEITVEDPQAGDRIVWDGASAVYIPGAQAAAKEVTVEELAVEALSVGASVIREFQRGARRFIRDVGPL